MAIPIAYFGYSKVGRTITFNNLSYNAPTSYQWGFGDGNTSTLKNPEHTYTEDGFYDVTLIATNVDGSSEELSVVLGISEAPDTNNSTLMESIDYFIPPTLQAGSSTKQKMEFINHWQTYLQPLVESPYVVDIVNIHNEFKWPVLVNNLIARLVAHSILLTNLSKFMIETGNQTVNQSGSENLTANAQIKSIETGPAKTEWYQAITSSSEDAKNVANAYQVTMAEGGAFEQLEKDICQLASRVRIYLPMCKNPSRKHFAPRVYKN